MILTGHVARTEEKTAYGVWFGIPEGKRRPVRNWVHKTEKCFTEIGWEGADWIDLAQDNYKWLAFVNTVVGFHKMRDFFI